MNHNRISQTLHFYKIRRDRSNLRKLTYDPTSSELLEQLKNETSRDSDQFSFQNIVETLSPIRKRNKPEVLSQKTTKTVNFFKIEKEFSLDEPCRTVKFKRPEQKCNYGKLSNKSMCETVRDRNKKKTKTTKSSKGSPLRVKISLID